MRNMEYGSTYGHKKGLSELEAIAKELRPTVEKCNMMKPNVIMEKKHHHWSEETAYRMRKIFASKASDRSFVSRVHKSSK